MKLTNEEINRTLHEFMGRCWHVWENPEYATGRCIKCCSRFGGGAQHNANPDYCSDDSPRRLLNEVVAKIDNDAEVTARIVGNIGYANFQIKATAEQIATACYHVIKEQEK